MQTTQTEQETKPPSPQETPRTTTRLDRFAALFVLTAFGITWPVLELLGENAEFFLARRSPKGEIVAIAIIATLIIPALIGLLGSLPGRVGTWIGAGLIFVTGTSLARLFLARANVLDWVDVGLAVVVGVGVTWAFFRYAAVRQTGRYLLPAPLVLLVVFLFAMPVGAVLREPDTAVGNPVAVANPVPVVLMVFDEFPVASIIDPQGDLRGERYPNFARLAADGTWYRNAVTVQQQTEHSVPAMLTGAVPSQSQTPVAGQYPFNLFTALRSSYDLHVYEAITQLCPRELCEGLTSSASSLGRDAGVVAGHVLLPAPLTGNLPEIDRGWGDFQTVAGDFDAREEFRELLADGVRTPIDRVLADIEAYDGESTPLFYLHAIVPHHPWQYLPDGRSYPFIVSDNPASLNGGWNDDDFLVAQSLQRHLLQVGYADHVLGEMIAALEASSLYEEAVVIVVADHGISIKPGVPHQRTITETTIGEIAAVPLFVKAPGVEGGVIDDRRAWTIDILPTIADVIEADLPGEIEGASLLGPPVEREQTTTIGPDTRVTFGPDGAEKLAVASRIEALFPGGDPWALLPEGAPDLVGEVVDVAGLAASDIRGEIKESDLYEAIDVSGDEIPARIGARLRGDVDGTEHIGVVVNGVVAAITRGYEEGSGFSVLAMVDPALFVDGPNQIELVEIAPSGDLERISTGS